MAPRGAQLIAFSALLLRPRANAAHEIVGRRYKRVMRFGAHKNGLASKERPGKSQRWAQDKTGGLRQVHTTGRRIGGGAAIRIGNSAGRWLAGRNGKRRRWEGGTSREATEPSP